MHGRGIAKPYLIPVRMSGFSDPALAAQTVRDLIFNLEDAVRTGRGEFFS
jgi:hypothetical protein